MKITFEIKDDSELARRLKGESEDIDASIYAKLILDLLQRNVREDTLLSAAASYADLAREKERLFQLWVGK